MTDKRVFGEELRAFKEKQEDFIILKIIRPRKFRSEISRKIEGFCKRSLFTLEGCVSHGYRSSTGCSEVEIGKANEHGLKQSAQYEFS